MKRLYAPWRTSYVTDTSLQKNREKSKDECVFCEQLQANNDEKYFILRRFDDTAVMLNLYPYNAGHLLVLPFEHHATLDKLPQKTRSEFIDVVAASERICHEVLKTDGANLGMNVGQAAGAGIPSHLHMHVLPRWTNDTNFMPLLADTKAISCDLHEIYKQLRPQFEQLVL